MISLGSSSETPLEEDWLKLFLRRFKLLIDWSKSWLLPQILFRVWRSLHLNHLPLASFKTRVRPFRDTSTATKFPALFSDLAWYIIVASIGDWCLVTKMPAALSSVFFLPASTLSRRRTCKKRTTIWLPWRGWQLPISDSVTWVPQKPANTSIDCWRQFFSIFSLSLLPEIRTSLQSKRKL